ncbi:MAG: winged helix-turn-helix transcriptional regulator [Lachnospiraceae bacterium]|nr:winged helix-turn-helix transcriptional regulator [Lachnospiraceae bacterium]
MQNQQGRELKEFNRLYREMDGLYHMLALHAGLSDSAMLILYALAEMGGGCLQKDIAASYGISRQTINSATKKLQQEGIITLTRGRKRDMHMHLTAAGEQLVKEKIFPIMELENRSFSLMPPEECEALLRLTEQYYLIFKKLCTDTYMEKKEAL